MKLKIVTANGFTEVIIDDNCELTKFYEVANLIKFEFGLMFLERLNDFDTCYWDFNYKNEKLTLFYNIYEGVTIIPQKMKDASLVENAKALEFGELLFAKLSNR